MTVNELFIITFFICVIYSCSTDASAMREYEILYHYIIEFVDCQFTCFHTDMYNADSHCIISTTETECMIGTTLHKRQCVSLWLLGQELNFEVIELI